jgi:ankyrin repeat protein
MCALVIAQMRVIRARIVCGINPSDFSQLPLFGRHTSKDRFVLVRKSKEHLQALGFTTENESMELMSMENGIRLASDLVESEDWKTSIQDEFHAKAAGLSSDEQLLFKCIVSEDLETLRDVLDRNVDVDVCHPVHGGRPLHVASGLGSIDAVQCLIRANAQVNARARNGATPLHWAAGAGNLKVAKLLLDAGADARIKTFTWNTNIGGKGSGQTPVHWAAESGFSNVIHVSMIQ